MNFVDPPAGKHGRVIASVDGQFAFADSPETARRFYGVNLCFGAHYLAHEEADRLAVRPSSRLIRRSNGRKDRKNTKREVVWMRAPIALQVSSHLFAKPSPFFTSFVSFG